MVLENFIVDAPIVWDRVGKNIFENPHVKQGRKMRVQITNAGMVEDLSGYTLALGWKHTVSGVDGLDVFEDSSEANVGIFEMAYTENLMTNLGNLKASLVLTSVEDMVVAESNDFYVKVDDSPFGANAEQGVGSYTMLAQILLNEEIRQEAYLRNEALVGSIDDKFDAFIQTNIVQEEVAEVFNNLEETYAQDIVSVKQQLEQAEADIDLLTRGLGETISSLALLNSTYPTGDTKDHIVAGNIAEVDTLTVTVIPTVASNITITLNGVAKTVAVDPAVQTTTALVATAIRGTTFTGWTTGGTGAVVTFTATTTGARTVPAFSGGTTGVKAAFAITIKGENANFHRYFWTGTVWADGGAYQALEITNGVVTLEKLGLDLSSIFQKTVVNLYNPNLAIDGKYANYGDGLYTVYPTSATSGRIPVKAGKTYTLSIPNTEAGLDINIRCFDTNGVFLGNTKAVASNPVASGITSSAQLNANGRKQLTLTTDPTSLVRFVETTIIHWYAEHTSADFERIRNSIQFEENAAFTAFETYDPTGKIVVMEKAIPTNALLETLAVQLSSSNVLYGKTLATAGDSITYGADMDAAGIDTDGSLMTYGYLTAKRNNMTFHNYGISGSTMQNIVGKNGFSDTRYTNMAANLDYLTIWFGWNDNAYGTLGTINDATDQTFYGAWNKVLPWLIQNYPTTKIGLVVPFGATVGHRQAVRDIGDKWGIPYLDLYGKNTPFFYGKEDSVGTQTNVATWRRSVFQANGAHPGSAGHAYLSTIFDNFLRSL